MIHSFGPRVGSPISRCFSRRLLEATTLSWCIVQLSIILPCVRSCPAADCGLRGAGGRCSRGDCCAMASRSGSTSPPARMPGAWPMTRFSAHRRAERATLSHSCGTLAVFLGALGAADPRLRAGSARRALGMPPLRFTPSTSGDPVVGAGACVAGRAGPYPRCMAVAGTST